MLKRAAIPAIAAALSIVAASSRTEGRQSKAPSRYLYVWAGSGTQKSAGVNSIVVIDVNPASPKYGSIIDAVTVDTAGNVPHHTEFELPKTGMFFASDYGADRTYLIDFSNPGHPRLAARADAVPDGHMVHSYARLPNGNVLATVQHGDMSIEGHPGGLAEFDNNGKLLRYGSSLDPSMPGAHIRTYALTTLPAIDRVVTTSSPMDDERTADVVQVWRMSDLKLLKTLAVPVVPGDSSSRYPFEVRALADGRTVMLNTYYCGFYRISGLETEPGIELVMKMDHPKNIGCSVPVIAGHFMLMPIAYGHRYATIDISDPSHPAEVSSVATDTTFFPHWISRDMSSDRVVVTDQGDGPPMVMIGHFNVNTGKLMWDEKFRDAGAMRPGLSFSNVSWPNGVKGKVTPHGAVFVP